MKPNELSKPGEAPVSDGYTSAAHRLSQKAAAAVIRTQIDTIYKKQENTPTNRSDLTTQEYLKKYHSAWQDYYQKYYEGYYTSKFKNQTAQNTQSDDKRSDEQIMEDLKKDLFGKISHSSKKIKKSRHFIPLAAGLVTILTIGFLQYNQLIISNVVAFVSPGKISAQNIILNSDSDIVVSADPKLIIPKINVDVPVLYDVGNDHASQMAAMSKGVAQFAIPGADSHPGQIGNTVIAGHSSNDLFETGDYKFIFTQLDRLEVGDSVYLNYHSTRYTYVVTKKEVVNPSQVDKLVYTTTKPMLTLITCTPLGTALNRLLVTAEQVSPDPAKATAINTSSDTKSNTSITGETKSFLEKIFN